MDRIEAMAALLEVLEAGSFSAAARTLGVPPTSLTRKVSELEARLGARLLHRSTRSLALTEAGAAYVVAARRIVEDVEEAERIAAGEYAEPRGELAITAPTMFGRLHVVPVVAQFLERFPRIDIRLQLTDAVVALADERIDLAVRLGDLADSSLVARHVGDMRTVTCASPGFFDMHGVPADPGDIARLPAIAVGAVAGQRHAWRFRDAHSGATLSVPLTPRLSVGTNEAAVEAAVLGVGLTQQRLYQVAEHLAAGTLRACLGGHEAPRRPVHVLQVTRDHLPLKARKFVDFAVPLLRARLSALAQAA